MGQDFVKQKALWTQKWIQEFKVTLAMTVSGVQHNEVDMSQLFSSLAVRRWAAIMNYPDQEVPDQQTISAETHGHSCPSPREGNST